MLKIYNTLTQEKQTFKPLQDKKVGLYVCGMTVYDLCHIGHARVLVAFDVVVRYLQSQGYQVNYVRNITDIDDKIIKRAQENNESLSDLTGRMIEAMHKDFSQLNILPPTHEPKATEAIAQMIDLIQALMEKGIAYQSDNGDIFYAVDKFKTYGELAHQDLEKLRRGSRVAVELTKKDALDFVLWKQAKPNEPSWDSPWGKGRPGWHIECSAMSMAALGEHFDIHGGGLDLVFPHHQNEIAQSEGATNKKFVNTWMHVGFVQINRQKMSKSLGNFFTVRDVLAEYPAEVVRYFLVASHYHSPIHYSQENLQAAQSALQRFYTSLRGLELNVALEDSDFSAQIKDYQKKFKAAMDDDFNTPEALAVLFDVVREINRVRETDLKQAVALASFLKQQAVVLGILQQNPEQFLKTGIQEEQSQKIDALIAARNKARAEKNWTEADRIRDELAGLGVSISDHASGTDWHRV
ncbi:cysteine--tRNA ligase [Rickettsiella endosymbiont of Dermanyssus gallinae]|uniref:cysteine--tRNA ligase n=1 Tax=Rickettsiella endosymbiont of Dermanyssus gallinae TaxID=2856608 RepID=UPI001C52D034|nr:cysteine--tRNA ligase [Rickettsiella endosymbiont of Dermanyssus gallinae]